MNSARNKNYGYNPRYSPAIPSSTDVSRADEFTKDLSELFKAFNRNIQQARKKQEEFGDKHHIKAPNFKPGDKVWINGSLIIHNEQKI